MSKNGQKSCFSPIFLLFSPKIAHFPAIFPHFPSIFLVFWPKSYHFQILPPKKRGGVPPPKKGVKNTKLTFWGVPPLLHVPGPYPHPPSQSIFARDAKTLFNFWGGYPPRGCVPGSGPPPFRPKKCAKTQKFFRSPPDWGFLSFLDSSTSFSDPFLPIFRSKKVHFSDGFGPPEESENDRKRPKNVTFFTFFQKSVFFSIFRGNRKLQNPAW